MSQVLWSGNPILKPWLIPIGKLQLLQSNTRRHTKESIDGIAESLKVFGQQTPAVIDEDFVVQKGNGTLMAAQLNEWTHLAAIPTDINDRDRLKIYSSVDNRTSEMSVFDVPELSMSIQSVYDKLKPEQWEKWWSNRELKPMLKIDLPEPEEGGRIPMGDPIQVTANERLTINRVFADFRAQEGDPDIREGRIIELILGDWQS